jgi:RHS repeat-associated protein
MCIGVYAGQYFDEETGLHYNLNRYYNPKTGRYLRADPFGDGLNLYAYVYNNPQGFIDPLGLCAISNGLDTLGRWLGTSFGEKAAMWYADKYNETGAWYYMAGGLLASLWTPETWTATATTLLAAGSAAKYLGRPFYQYYTKGTQYTGKWMARGKGWKAPHKLGKDAQKALNLPKWNKATAVQKYSPKWYKPIKGPRTPKPQPQWGWPNKGTGKEYYQGWRWSE